MRRRRTTAHEKVLYFVSGEGNVRDRFETSAMSLSNSVIADASQAPLSVARCKAKHVWENLTHAWHPVVFSLHHEQQAHPMTRNRYRLFLLCALYPSSSFLCSFLPSPLFHGRVKNDADPLP